MTRAHSDPTELEHRSRSLLCRIFCAEPVTTSIGKCSGTNARFRLEGCTQSGRRRDVRRRLERTRFWTRTTFSCRRLISAWRSRMKTARAMRMPLASCRPSACAFLYCFSALWPRRRPRVEHGWSHAANMTVRAKPDRARPLRPAHNRASSPSRPALSTGPCGENTFARAALSHCTIPPSLGCGYPMEADEYQMICETNHDHSNDRDHCVAGVCHESFRFR